MFVCFQLNCKTEERIENWKNAKKNYSRSIYAKLVQGFQSQWTYLRKFSNSAQCFDTFSNGVHICNNFVLLLIKYQNLFLKKIMDY